MAQRQNLLLVAMAFLAGLVGGAVGGRIFPASSFTVLEAQSIKLVGESGRIFARLEVDRVALSRVKEFDGNGTVFNSDSTYIARPRFELLDGNGKVVWTPPVGLGLIPLAQR